MGSDTYQCRSGMTADSVPGQLIQSQFIKSRRPDVHLVWSGYHIPVLLRSYRLMPILQTSHRFTADGSNGFDLAEISTVRIHFQITVLNKLYSNDPRITFIPAMGLMQYDFSAVFIPLVSSQRYICCS